MATLTPGPKTLYRLSIEWHTNLCESWIPPQREDWLSSLRKFLTENGWTEDND